MAQRFRKDYNKAMSTLPVVRSNFQILRVEAWITNRTGATTDTRDVVGFMDLGEKNPFNQSWVTSSGEDLPNNNSNSLYQTLVNAGPIARNSTQVQTYLNGLNGMQPVQELKKLLRENYSKAIIILTHKLVSFLLTSRYNPMKFWR
jgi:cell surface protein SprA